MPESRRRFESVPVPKTIADATIRLGENDFTSVSHKIDDKIPQKEIHERFLNSANHAFYMGKMRATPFTDRVRLFFDWEEVDLGVYSIEFIEEALAYQFAHLEDGERAIFIIAPELSELMNGEKTMKGHLSPEDEKALIYKIAKTKFGKGAEELTVTRMQEMKEHKEIFEALRAANNPEEGVDIEKALENTEDLPITNSLRIAALLYEGAQNWRGLNKDLFHTMTDEQKNDETRLKSAEYYGLVELAIRLSDILAGRNIHGGVNRQSVYDKIIHKIKKGKFKKVEAIRPLFEALKNKEFHTLHLSDEKNWHGFATKRRRAITRAAVYMALIGTMLFGAHRCGEKHEQDRRTRIEAQTEARIKESIKNITFRFEGKWEVDKKENINVYRGIKNQMLGDIRYRYSLSESELEEIGGLLDDYLCSKDVRYYLPQMSSEGHFRLLMTDRFIAQYPNFFHNELDRVISRPYIKFKYLEDSFEEFLESDTEIEIESDDIEQEGIICGPYSPNIVGIKTKEKAFERIGIYANFIGSEYEIYKEKGENIFLARFYDLDYPMPIDTTTARRVINEYFISIKKFDIAPLYDWFYDFHNLHTEKNKIERISIEGDRIVYNRLPDYVDSFGKFEFELGLYRDQIVARYPGEDNFTTERAIEAANHFFIAYGGHRPDNPYLR